MVSIILNSSEYLGTAWLDSLAQWKGRGGFGIQKTEVIHPRLGRPGDSFKSFHVAGTNGKGSVSCSIAAVLGARGAKVGLYTSPHLQRINERIVIDGEEITDPDLDRACIEIKNACSDIEISFFEAITLVAFVAFRNCGVDYGVIEVGLGGRLDSTNVLNAPLASVITTIDFDHEEILGDTLRKIAGEKAGIIKAGIPLIVGRITGEALERILEVRGAGEAYLLGRDFSAQEALLQIAGDQFTFGSSFFGDYQRDNLAVALAAIYFGLRLQTSAEPDLKSWKEAFVFGPCNTYWPNRLESIVWRDKKVLIDSAHNPAGIRSLISFLDSNDSEFGAEKVDIVFGVIGTKRWQEMLDALMPYTDQFYLALPDFAQPVGLRQLHDYLTNKSIKSTCYANDSDLVEALSESTSKHIVCCGSMYLTGRLRSSFGAAMRPRWIRGKLE